MSVEPAFDGYFADPFLLRTDRGYIAYGSSEPFTTAGASFQALVSTDLATWKSAGTVFTCDDSIGTDAWAPEVVQTGDGYWMYYSAGFGISDHHIRVAHADQPLGPFIDCGVNLTPDESFAIDPHPFLDTDGSRYLYYARDVLNAERPGTHLAVQRMTSMTALDHEPIAILTPNADWQLYEAHRSMYGRSLDWYTLEGPTVAHRNGRYTLFYSGGSWEGPDYGVSYATAPNVRGPWTHASPDTAVTLSRALTGQRGPGHNSVLQLDNGESVIAYHAWDHDGTKRQMYVSGLDWTDTGPQLQPGPLDTERTTGGTWHEPPIAHAGTQTLTGHPPDPGAPKSPH